MASYMEPPSSSAASSTEGKAGTTTTTTTTTNDTTTGGTNENNETTKPTDDKGGKNLYGIRTIPVQQVPIKPPSKDHKRPGRLGDGQNAAPTVDPYTARLLATVNEGRHRSTVYSDRVSVRGSYGTQPGYKTLYGL